MLTRYMKLLNRSQSNNKNVSVTFKYNCVFCRDGFHAVRVQYKVSGIWHRSDPVDRQQCPGLSSSADESSTPGRHRHSHIASLAVADLGSGAVVPIISAIIGSHFLEFN